MDETTKRTRRENLAMKIMILRDRCLDNELTTAEALELAVSIITEYEYVEQTNGRAEVRIQEVL